MLSVTFVSLDFGFRRDGRTRVGGCRFKAVGATCDGQHDIKRYLHGQDSHVSRDPSEAPCLFEGVQAIELRQKVLSLQIRGTATRET